MHTRLELFVTGAILVCFSVSVVHASDQDIAVQLSNTGIKDLSGISVPSVISPLNVFHALSLLFAGLTNTTAFSTILDGNSPTSVINGISTLLQTSIPASLTTTNLSIASVAFLNPQVVGAPSESYNSSLAKLNASVVLNTNLKAADVNTWISTQTRGKIDNVVKDSDVAGKTVLVSALYFQDHWLKEFAPTSSPIAFATLPSASSTQIQHTNLNAMVSEVSTLVETDAFIGFSKPFLPMQQKQSPFTAYFFMAKREIGKADLTANAFPTAAELASFDAKTVFADKNLFNGVATVKVPAVVEVSSQVNLLTEWAKLPKYAPLLRTFGFLGAREFLIEQAIHVAKVKIDKEGFEGAAVTVLIGDAVSAGPGSSRNVTFDRPFGFQIVHTPSNAVLFHGVYTPSGVISDKVPTATGGAGRGAGLLWISVLASIAVVWILA
ncbi:Serpin domain-containing protein [Cladochytrium replicatum]|nr:Serpin domain-containing protein [Cladochytrium replicatum]